MKSDTGDYAGGIAGNSVSAISNSYSLCNVNAKDYVGGIVGSGYTVKNCVSASTITSDGEGLGSIAGTVSEEGEVKGNILWAMTLMELTTSTMRGLQMKKVMKRS